MKPLKALFGQTIVYGMGTIVPRLLNYLLLTPFYTYIFIANEYGVITELYAYVAFLFVILTYGMETTFFRFSQNSKEAGKVFATSSLALALTSTLFIVLAVFFSDQIAGFLQYPSNPEYIVILAIIIGIDAFLAIPFAKLRLENKALNFTIIKIINVIVNIGFNLFFLLLCPKLEQINPDSPLLLIYNPNVGVGYAFVSNLIATLVTLLLLLPVIFKNSFAFSVSLIKKMLSYTLPLLIVGIAGMINEVSDKILFKFLLKIPEGTEDKHLYILEQLGIYGANFKLAVLMTLFIQMFRYAAEPFFFSHSKDKDSKELYATVMKYFVLFGLFIFLIVTLYLDIFKYFIGPEFRIGLHIVPIVLLANLFLGILFNLSFWYKLTDKTLYGALIAITGSIITIVLNIVLIPSYGFTGAAWAHFFCYASMLILSFILMRKFFPIPYNLKSLGFYIILALIIYFTTTYISIEDLTYKLIINSVFMVFYVTIILIFEKKNLLKK
ncbi:polysaccharide biosynthesis C-terminal domain-containing protein [Bacteroidota bacterium]